MNQAFGQPSKAVQNRYGYSYNITAFQNSSGEVFLDLLTRCVLQPMADMVKKNGRDKALQAKFTDVLRSVFLNKHWTLDICLARWAHNRVHGQWHLGKLMVAVA